MIYYDRNGVVVREARAEDVKSLANRLREKDAEEVMAEGFSSAEDALRFAFENASLVLTAEFEGVPVAMFGLVPTSLVSDVAQAWFLGAPELARIKKTFVRLSRVVIKMMLERHAVLYNIVDCRYPEAISWLESLGAKFEPPLPCGPKGLPFRQFTIRRS